MRRSMVAITLTAAATATATTGGTIRAGFRRGL
jgi:hypothetical protein